MIIRQLIINDYHLENVYLDEKIILAQRMKHRFEYC